MFNVKKKEDEKCRLHFLSKAKMHIKYLYLRRNKKNTLHAKIVKIEKKSKHSIIKN
jgi:hypothetical protein